MKTKTQKQNNIMKPSQQIGAIQKQDGSALTIYMLTLQIMNCEELLASELGNHRGHAKGLLTESIRAVKQFNKAVERAFKFDPFNMESNRFILNDFCH